MTATTPTSTTKQTKISNQTKNSYFLSIPIAPKFRGGVSPKGIIQGRVYQFINSHKIQKNLSLYLTLFPFLKLF